jgi:hypothetical protein
MFFSIPLDAFASYHFSHSRRYPPFDMIFSSAPFLHTCIINLTFAFASSFLLCIHTNVVSLLPLGLSCLGADSEACFGLLLLSHCLVECDVWSGSV